MADRYIRRIAIDAVAVSAVQDLVEALCGANKTFVLREVLLGQSSDFGDAAAEGLRLRIKRATSGYTSGSGGSAGTVTKQRSTDAATGITAEINNTTQAVAGTGAIEVLAAVGWNIQFPLCYRPDAEERPEFTDGQALLIDLPGAPADALTVSGTIVLEEVVLPS